MSLSASSTSGSGESLGSESRWYQQSASCSSSPLGSEWKPKSWGLCSCSRQADSGGSDITFAELCLSLPSYSLRLANLSMGQISSSS